jgi:ribosomal protein L20
MTKEGKPLSYSKFIGALNKGGIKINRKMLSALAEHSPKTLERVVAKVS